MTEPTPSGTAENAVLIDWTQLSEEALRNVLEDLVTRGEPDSVSVEECCAQLLLALKSGKTKLYFDDEEKTVFLAPRS